MTEVKDEELLPFGWAPGGYTIACSKCSGGKAPMDQWGAKRSWRCRPHAVADLEETKRRVRALTTRKPESAPAAGGQKSQVDGSSDQGLQARRNLYIVQTGAVRLIEALRKIAAESEDPMAKNVARNALNNKQPLPKWSDLPGLDA